MKTLNKKVLSIIGVSAFAVAIAFNMNTNVNNNKGVDVALSNVEALAQGETPDGCVLHLGSICSSSSYDLYNYRYR